MNYLALVGPNETEVTLDYQSERNIKDIAQDAVRNLKLQTPRKNPQKVKVQVFRLTIKAGKLERTKLANESVMPSLSRMTVDEYREEMDEILRQLPPDFRNYVETESYDDGHSAGYEEVITIAHNRINALLPAINAYRQSLWQSRETPGIWDRINPNKVPG